MSEPIVVRRGNTCYVSWPENDNNYRDISMKFSSFNDERGDLRPLVQVSVSGRSGYEHDGRINLNSATGKKTAANRCADSFPNISWGTAIDDACKEVRNVWEKGEPWINLKERPRSEATKHMIEPLLLSNSHNMLYGDGGLGKSWVSLYFAVLVASGHTHNGFTAEPGDVLYLDYETHEDDMNDRFKALCKGMNISPSNLHYRFAKRSVTDDVDSLLDKIQETDAKLIIVDSAAPAAGGEAEKSNTAKTYHNALRELEITALTIAHVTKSDPNEDKKSTPYGSVFYRNLPRNIWEIKQGETYTRTVKELGLYQTKYNSGAGEDPIGLRLTFDDPKDAREVFVERIGMQDNDDLGGRQDWWLKIEQAILERRRASFARPFEGMTVKEIADRWDTDSTGSIQTTLSQASKKGKFIKVKHGYWDIKSEAEEDKRIASMEIKY